MGEGSRSRSTGHVQDPVSFECGEPCPAPAAAVPFQAPPMTSQPVSAEPLPSSGVATPSEWVGITTVMMRNLPNDLTRRMLLQELNRSGFLGSYDFIYVPINLETKLNRGYAFINFTGQESAWLFFLTYNRSKVISGSESHVVSVSQAVLQGFEA